jgi:hypothetical protein
MLHQWQLDLLDKMTNRNGKELKISMGGRNIGKSHWTNMAIDRLMRDLNSHPISDLVLSEGTVYGSRYYCVEPVGGNWPDMEIWSLDTYGNCGSMWDKDKAPELNARWYMNDRRFWFREEKDRNWFIMKWSAA